MRIFPINNVPNFKAGKVHVYSDFDGTYCPAKHHSLHIEGENKYMIDYCHKMKNFFDATEGDIHFHITTGRTFGEYEAISHLLKLRNFQLPIPETFIAKNGSDEYVRLGDNITFYKDGIFPFEYCEPDLVKEAEIQKLTNWDGKKIKTFIKDLSAKYQLRMVEADSENSVGDYGNNSLFSKGKLNPDEWMKMPVNDGIIQQHEKPVVDYVIGSRNDGNLKINLIFSPDYGFCSERNYIYDNFMNEIKEYLRQQNVEYDMSWEAANAGNYYRNRCSITPKINGGALTKLYDTKEALKNAVKSGDIIIVAGDGPNDFEMLNPLEYIDLKDLEICKKESNCKEFFDSDMNKKLLCLKDVFLGKNNKLKQELENCGFIKKLKDMPFYSIIIERKNPKLDILRETFGLIGKVVSVKEGELDKGIKEIIKQHSIGKDEFKNSMSEKFKQYILGAQKNIENDEKSKKYPAVAIGLIIAGIGGYTAYRLIRKGNSSEIVTNQTTDDEF